MFLGSKPKQFFPAKFKYTPYVHCHGILSTVTDKPSPPDYTHNRRFASPFKDNHGNPITGEPRTTNISKEKKTIHENPVDLNYKHGSLLTSDIQGASPKPPLTRLSPRDPLYISDIEGTSTKVTKVNTPRNPLWVIKSVPKKIRDTHDNLFVGDIEGAVVSKPRKQRQEYNYIDYSDVVYSHDKCYSVDLPRPVIQLEGELVTQKKLPEPRNYKEIAKQGMRLVRAIGSKAAWILREARMLKSRKKKARSNLITPMKSTKEQPEFSPSKSTADTFTKQRISKFNQDISAV